MMNAKDFYIEWMQAHDGEMPSDEEYISYVEGELLKEQERREEEVEAKWGPGVEGLDEE